jgi:hypothetical protein
MIRTVLKCSSLRLWITHGIVTTLILNPFILAQAKITSKGGHPEEAQQARGPASVDPEEDLNPSAKKEQPSSPSTNSSTTPSSSATLPPAKGTPPPEPAKMQDAQLVNCQMIPVKNFNFPSFNEAYEKFEKAKAAYAAECQQTKLDEKVSTVAVTSDGHGAAQVADGNAKAAATGLVVKETFEAKCKDLYAKVEEEKNRAEKELKAFRASCEQEAITIGQQAGSISLCAEPIASNKKSCEKNGEEKKDSISEVWDWVMDNKLLVAGLLTAVGGGLYSMLSSSEKQGNDFKTDPKSFEKPETKTPETKTPTEKPKDTVADERFNPLTAPYCQSSQKPLECFVTPGCDMKCVASKYGVPDYAGMDRDTTRIDQDGRVVDGISGLAAASAGKSGTGGGKGGSPAGGLDLLETSETATDHPLAATRSLYNFGDEVTYGGGGVGDGDRDPASEGRYKGANDSSLTTAKAAKDPAATGPILPPTANIFDRVWGASRTQCVRGFLMCNFP